MEKITFGLRKSASFICPCSTNIVARVTPQPGQGILNISLEGQTVIATCPSPNHVIATHKQTARYAITE